MLYLEIRRLRLDKLSKVLQSQGSKGYIVDEILVLNIPNRCHLPLYTQHSIIALHIRNESYKSDVIFLVLRWEY